MSFNDLSQILLVESLFLAKHNIFAFCWEKVAASSNQFARAINNDCELIIHRICLNIYDRLFGLLLNLLNLFDVDNFDDSAHNTNRNFYCILTVDINI